MYDNIRMFYDNYLYGLAAANILNEDSAGALASGVIKSGAGSATMLATVTAQDMPYPDDLIFTVEIHDVTGGKEIGQAKWRARMNTTTPGSWYTWDNLTSASNQHINYRLSIRFVAGTGDDFALGDTFYVTRRVPFSVRRAMDERRDTLLKTTDSSGSATHEYTFDLGAATRIRAAALFDVSGAEISSVQIKAGTTNTCGSYTGTFDHIAYNPIFYLDETYRYWRFKINNVLYTDYINYVGQMYLGDYVEFPAGAMYNWGSSERLVSEMADNALFDYPRRILANRRELTLKWQNVHTDYRSYFDNLYAATRQASDGMEHPVFVHLDPTDDGETLYWMKLTNDLDREWTQYQHDSLTLQFREVAANYAL